MSKTAAAPAKTGDDILSSLALVPVRHVEVTADFETHIPTVEDGMEMPAEKLKTLLQATLVAVVVFDTAARNLVAAANRRMQTGELIGGCGTLKAFVEKFVRRDGQSIEAAVRRIYRLLNGVGVNEKYDSSEARAAIKAAAEEKAKLIAAKAADKAARLALEERVRQAKALKEKSNAEAVEAAFEKQKNVTQAEIEAEAAKMQRPLVQQLETAERKIKDAARIADRKSKADVAAENLVHYILQTVSSSGTVSVTAAKEIYVLASKFRICQKGEAA